MFVALSSFLASVYLRKQEKIFKHLKLSHLINLKLDKVTLDVGNCIIIVIIISGIIIKFCKLVA